MFWGYHHLRKHPPFRCELLNFGGVSALNNSLGNFFPQMLTWHCWKFVEHHMTTLQLLVNSLGEQPMTGSNKFVFHVLPPRELTYPIKNHFWRWFSFFSWWDMLVPWRVVLLFFWKGFLGKKWMMAKQTHGQKRRFEVGKLQNRSLSWAKKQGRKYVSRQRWCFLEHMQHGVQNVQMLRVVLGSA